MKKEACCHLLTHIYICGKIIKIAHFFLPPLFSFPGSQSQALRYKNKFTRGNICAWGGCSSSDGLGAAKHSQRPEGNKALPQCLPGPSPLQGCPSRRAHRGRHWPPGLVEVRRAPQFTGGWDVHRTVPLPKTRRAGSRRLHATPAFLPPLPGVGLHLAFPQPAITACCSSEGQGACVRMDFFLKTSFGGFAGVL